MNLKGRNFLTLKDFTPEEILYLLDLSAELLNNEKIIRSKRKINAAIKNAQIFIDIQKEFGSFSKYLWGYTDYQIIKNQDDKIKTTSKLSDCISADLKKRGMSFVGSITIYSYLQAVGVVNDHETDCFCYQR